MIIAMIAAALIVMSAIGYAAWEHFAPVPPSEFVLGTWQPAPEPTPDLRLGMRFAPPAPITWRGMKMTPRENIRLRKALEAQEALP